MRLLLLCALFIALSVNSSQAQTDQRVSPYTDISAVADTGMPPFIGLNRKANKVIFDRQNNVTNKVPEILKMRQDGTIMDNKFIVGARFLGQSMYEKTNTAGKFPILSRLPPAHTKDDSGTVNVVKDASINMTAALPFSTFFLQGEYTESAYPGQERHQWRKYWVTLGDLDVFPAYLTFGKKTVAFGDMSSYAPFTHSHNSHYFWAQNDDDPLFELGYIDHGWHVAGSLIKNDRGLRVLNAPQNENGYENFALNATKEFMIGTDRRIKVGAGYLRGTIYDSSVAHHPPTFGAQDRDWASAYNVHAVYNTPDYDLMAEFTQTVDEWGATDANVHALTLQGRYRDYIGKFPATYSLMWSEGVQGESGDEWERMMQTVVGAEINVHPSVSIGVEYLNNIDFVPLILPRITADDGVVSHTFIIGTTITF